MSHERFDQTSLEPREAFEARYRESHPDAEFGVDRISVPCSCEDGGGPWHWAVARNCPALIEAHYRHEVVLADLRQINAMRC